MTSGPMTIRLADGIRRRLERMAESKGTTPSGVARDLIEAALTRQDLAVKLSQIEESIDASISLSLQLMYMVGIMVKSSLDPNKQEELLAGLIAKAAAQAATEINKVKKSTRTINNKEES